ncbi:MAG: flagellar basal body P-ring protein FlgI [Pirellulales bacterium]|nr:flagellar basal body P-ring protein FlgI [Pirellulales bacterium]
MRPHTSLALLLLMLTLSGCQGWFSRVSTSSQSPDEQTEEQPQSEITLVDDVAFAFGRDRIDVEGVGLVVGLSGTGGDPEPSIYRTQLLDEMKKREVADPNKLLKSLNTALVLVRGVIRPGMEKGDTFDMEIKVPPGSSATSLRGGFLMQTRLSEVAFAGGSLRRGSLLGLGKGYVLVDPSADSADALRGRVLGGGTSLKKHDVGLVLRPEFQTIAYSAQVGEAANRRFHTYVSGNKEKVANPKTDEFIELSIHPHYKNNVSRYLRVIGSLPLRESATDRIERLDLLQQELETPSKSARAALQLEAIGNEAIPVLVSALNSQFAEVRFYAAEALAYIDDSKTKRDAAAALAEAARQEPAFRVYALTALSSMNDADAYAELTSMLHVPSAETRYGAFRALWAMNSHDALVRADESLKDKFSYHVISSGGPPMIHVTTSFQPEVVVFGNNIRLLTPFVLDAGAEILVRGQKDGSVLVSKISLNQPDQKRMVSSDIDEVIRTIAELGGQYHDVVELLQEASKRGLLSNNCRLEVDAIPKSGRRYTPESQEIAGSTRNSPSLFAGFFEDDRPQESRDAPYVTQPAKEPGLWSRMFDW